MRRRRTSGNSTNDFSKAGKEETNNAWSLHDDLNESSQDLLASPSLHSPINRSHWRVNQTPISESGRSRSKNRSYIEKPRVSLKETEDRKLTVQVAVDSAIQQGTPASTSNRRRKFLEQQQKTLEGTQRESLRDAVKWNALHDSDDRIIAQVMKNKIATPETPTGRRDSQRTETTQSSSHSTIMTMGDSQPQSPYFRSWQPSKSSLLQGVSPSPMKQHSPPRNTPTQSKSTDSFTIMASSIRSPKSNNPPISKSTRNLMGSTNKSMFHNKEKAKSKHSSSTGGGSNNVKQSVDDAASIVNTTTMVLLDNAPSTPQSRRKSKPTLQKLSMDVSPWLRGSNADGDGSSSKALHPPVRTPEGDRAKKKHPSPKQQLSQERRTYTKGDDDRPNLEDSLQINYTPDSINRTIEEQRALAKEMAEELSKLPDISAATSKGADVRKSWVAAERENVSLHGQQETVLERSPSLRSNTTRTRWTGRRRIQSSRSLVHKREHAGLTNLSGHSQGSVGARPRSHSPASGVGTHHSRTEHLSTSGHSRGSRSETHSPLESGERKGRRPPSYRKNKPHDGGKKTRTEKREKSSRITVDNKDVGEKQDHTMSIQVSEHFIDEEGRSVNIEVKGTMEKDKPKRKERSALQRRRMERRQPGQTVSLREARTFTRPQKSTRHRSLSPTRNGAVLLQQPDRQSKGDKPDVTIPENPETEDHKEIVQDSPMPSVADKSITKQDEEPSQEHNSPEHETTTLFECSINGNNHVIDLEDWDSASSDHSMDSRSIDSTPYPQKSVSPRRRTVPIEPDGERCMDSTLPASIKQDSTSSSLGLDNVIHHMDAIHDLEQLARVKTEAINKRNRERKTQARERLTQLVDGKILAQDFGKRYQLSKDETQKLMHHVQLSIKTNEDVRWDLVFPILQLPS